MWKRNKTEREAPQALSPQAIHADPDRLLGLEVDGRYQLNRFLGQGNFGCVYAAEEMVGDDLVGTCAIKLLWPGGPQERAAVLSEIRSMARFEHPRLVAYRGAGAIASGALAGTIYVAMQLGEGSAEQLLAEGPVSVEETQSLLRDLADALAYLHGLGVIHRDVKPGNLLRIGSAWKLGDFGLLRGTESSRGPREDTFEGTPLYLAPETMNDVWTPAVDVWALGVIAYRSLSGKFPYNAEDITELMARIVVEEPDLSVPLPSPFDALVRGCLDKDHARRWNVQHVLDALERRSLHATPPVAERRVQASARPVAPGPLNTVRYLVEAHRSPVRAVAFSLDGAVLATGAADGKAMLWDAASGGAITEAPHSGGPITCLAFAPLGTVLAIGSGKTVDLWDASGARAAMRLRHDDLVSDVAFAPDGRLLATSSRDGTVRLWHAATGDLEVRLKPHGAAVRAIAFAPDGAFLVAASDDRLISLTDVGLQQQVGEWKGHAGGVLSVAWAPAGAWLVSGSADGSARLWRADRPGTPPTRQYVGTKGDVTTVAFSPCGRRVAGGSSDCTVHIWDVGREHPVGRLPGHGGPVHAVAFSPDGTILASGAADGVAAIWNVG
ncbi:MAG: hypothetical protein FJX76_13800 [Armatimonadetes bacterium]|nr:hypothetical protein [Armatimonadota bacterium]